MRMIKNSPKGHRADKKGVILVTVLFILAMAMIFISCALLLTSATRGRVYEGTEKSQARLTLTSAIESFYQALQMQEITDDALEAYADANATLQVIMDDNTIPGMYASGPAGGTDNVTNAKFYNTTVGGKDYVVVDFTTTIGDKTENARAFLYENEIPEPPQLFNSQVDYNGPMGNNFRGGIGKHNFSSNPTDNIVVWRGDYHSNQSQGTPTYSDMLFIGGNGAGAKKAYFENNEHILGDMIFMDNYTLSWSSTAGNFDGDVYFLGPGGKAGAFSDSSDASRSYAKSNSVWLFANRTGNAGSGESPKITFNMLTGSKATLFLKSPTGGWDASLASALSSGNNYSSKMSSWQTAYNNGTYTSKVNKAKRFYTTDTSSLVQVYPTTSQMKSQYGMPISASDCTGYTSTTLGALCSTYSGQMIPAGNYLITAGGGNHEVGGDSVAVTKLFLDGSADYIFYFNTSVDINGIIFAVVNPSQDHHQYFILGPGKSMTISHDNNNASKVTSGFMSVSRTGSSSPSTYSSAIDGLSPAACKSAYDGIKKPTIQIYCMDNNFVQIKRQSVVEAYVGMFQSSYSSQTSELNVMNLQTSQFAFYGRIMATKITNTSGDFGMPYCPAPNVHNAEEYTEVSSKYKVASLQYYYGDGTIPD